MIRDWDEQRRWEAQMQAQYEADMQRQYDEDMEREAAEQRYEEHIRAMGGDRGFVGVRVVL